MSKAKKVLVIIVCAILLINSTMFAAGSREQKDSGKKKIAVLVHNMQATYAAWLAQSFEKYAADFPEFDITIFDGKEQLSTQVAQLETAVANGYDMIWIQAVDVTASFSHINWVIEQGVPCGTVNNTNMPGSPLASVVDSDPIEQGSIPAAVARELLPKNAKVVILLGPAGNVHSNGRRIGYQQTLFDQRPDIEILDEQIANWMKGEAMTLMENWLEKYPKIDGILSMNDGMAIGALEAVKAAGREGEMTSYGVDGLADAVLSIKAGDLTATCVQDADNQAYSALEISRRILSGEIERGESITHGVLVTSENVDEWIQIHRENGQIKD